MLRRGYRNARQSCSTFIENYRKPKILEAFLQKYPKWRQEVRAKGDLYKQCRSSLGMDDAPEDAQVLMQSADKHTKNYYQQNISCPFLNDDLCLIYEVRPYSCAALFAFTPTHYCRPDSAATPDALRAFSVEVINDRSFYYGRLEKPVISFMPIAVYEIIKIGIYYLSRSGIPGLDNLEYEFYADTEVVSTLHRHGLRR